MPKYYLEGSHKAIINLEEYTQIQEEIKRKDSIINKKAIQRKHLFTSLIV